MNPDAQTLWRAPRWALAILLACLGMLGPFSIDTYLPAFTGIAQAIHATPVEMQQTLSAYLFGFAVMNLFHGALSDSFGRRPVVLSGLVVFTLASAGCALSRCSRNSRTRREGSENRRYLHADASGWRDRHAR